MSQHVAHRHSDEIHELRARNTELLTALEEALGMLEAIEILELGRTEHQRKTIKATCDRLTAIAKAEGK